MKKSLAEWLQYLEKLNPHQIRLGLERIQQIAQSLNLFKFSCPVITVTGTNGKGSCVAFLENIYRAAGYRVGAYTSPHLFRFTERIRLDGVEVSEDILCDAFALIENYRQNIPLSYFEFITLAALQIFHTANLDVLILEIGLGGRLDAVNIVENDLAVITTIGIDHVEWLGNNRESIGREKAGIFRPNKLAICGDPDPPSSVINIAKELNTQLTIAGRDFFYEKFNTYWLWSTSDRELISLPLPELDCQNAATALMAINLLQPLLSVSATAISQGLVQANLPGRFQKWGQYLFDVAHNPHAAEWFVKKLRQENTYTRTLAVVGMLKDKDIQGTLGILKNEVAEWYVGGLEGPRGAPGHLLMENLAQIGVKKCYNYRFLREAFAAARAACKQQDRIVVFGSFHTVGLCLSEIQDC